MHVEHHRSLLHHISLSQYRHSDVSMPELFQPPDLELRHESMGETIEEDDVSRMILLCICLFEPTIVERHLLEHR